MKWLKAALIGMLGAVVMFAIMMAGIHAGIAPFHITPSAAFLQRFGWNVGPLALLVHLGYGAFWSMALVYLFGQETDIGRGIGLALALWLFMMIVYSPIIGWGLFGFGSAHLLPAGNPLHLAQGPRYLVVTLGLHLVYGAIIGWLDPIWIGLRGEGGIRHFREGEQGA